MKVPVIIREDRFQEHCNTLWSMEAALGNIGIQLHRITDEFDEKMNVPRWIEADLQAIGSTLQCLGKTAQVLSDEASTWRYWAAKTDANIVYED